MNWNEIIIWYIIYLTIIFIPFIFRLFKDDDINDHIKQLESYESQIKCMRDLYPKETKVCEYCNVKMELTDNYCLLCGTGLVIEK